MNYNKDRRELTFWRSVNGQEVDFVIGTEVAIQVKATSRIQPKHLKGIKALEEEVKLSHKIIISLDDKKRVLDGQYIVYPFDEFVTELWDKKIF